jgi:hypothetical protein
MTTSASVVPIVCAALFVVLGIYVLGLWIFALIRTGFFFCYIFVGTGALHLIISAINLALQVDPPIGIRLLGQPGARIFYYAYLWIQPATLFISAIGTTMLVIRLTRRPNHAIERTADRCSDDL